MISSNDLPAKIGVYLFKNSRGEIIYIGKALNIKKRVAAYARMAKDDPKTASLVASIAQIATIETLSELDALVLEAELIRTHKPRYNVIWRDDKHPLYIKISIQDEFPKITMVRKEDVAGAIYFGPFPSSKTVRQVIMQLRHIFPFCSQKGIGKRVCFYTHIGLCDPCPSALIHASVNSHAQGRKRYRRNINCIKKILAGKSLQVIYELQKEMQNHARKYEFKQAAKIRDQIVRLRYVTQQHFDIRAYIDMPTFAADERQRELASLVKVIHDVHAKSALVVDPPSSLNHIECFDISTTSGKWGTGSMVTFKHGAADKNLYRRFRIQTQAARSDTAMMQEVLKRRFMHSDWSYPNLVMVDGGKAQLSIALSVIKDCRLSLLVIALAKRLEELVFPLKGKISFKIVRLAPGTPEFHLLTRIRDEAHRFALTYHRKLRTPLAV